MASAALRGDVQVAGDNRFARAGAQGKDRDDAEDDEGEKCRAGEDQGEAGRDVADPEGHFSSGWSCSAGDRAPEPQTGALKMSRPGSEGTSNRVLTARNRSPHARKIAGGSSTMAR